MAALAPMLAIVRGRLAARVSAHARATANRTARTGRRVLVSSQLALAVMVVAVTGLLTQSLLRLQAIDAGLDVDRLVLASLSVPHAISSDRHRHLRLLDAVLTRLRAAQSIAAATPINASPFSGVGWSVPAFVAEGQDPARAAANPPLDLEAVHPGYFDTLGVGLVRGRAFAAADRDGALPVAIVSEDVAARTWPGENPIGRRLKMGTAATNSDWLTVVGVARATRYRELATQRPVLYVPAEQLIVAAQSIAVRSSAPLADTAAAIRAAVRAVDPAVGVTEVVPLEDLRQAPMARPRFTASLIGTFAVAALLLSTVGVFSVTAAAVHQRRHELRVRMALGATPGHLQRLVLGEGLRLALVGVAVGTVGAIAAAQSLQGLLYEVGPIDPPSLAGAAALLLLSSLLACAVPAWRAARVNPLAALREE
jgi:predicted permease